VIHDLRRRVTERLDGGGFEVAQPEWSPDGSEIAYQSDHEDGVKNIYRIAADGSGTPERVAPANFYQAMLDWSSTGVIAYQQDGDVWVVPPGEEPQPLLQSEHRHSHATFSPDGRWIAYVYNGEVYVRPYPGPDAPIRISDDGGNAPMWSWDGRRIFFRRGPITERVLLAAELQIDGGDLRASRPAVMIPNWSYQGYTPMRSPDVFSDGSFLAIAYQDAFEDPDNFSPRTADRFRVENFHVVLNFAEELSPEFGRQ
jgi:Tol biopolymer transport system component